MDNQELNILLEEIDSKYSLSLSNSSSLLNKEILELLDKVKSILNYKDLLSSLEKEILDGIQYDLLLKEEKYVEAIDSVGFFSDCIPVDNCLFSGREIYENVISNLKNRTEEV